jgi:hypothetical protein
MKKNQYFVRFSLSYVYQLCPVWLFLQVLKHTAYSFSYLHQGGIQL